MKWLVLFFFAASCSAADLENGWVAEVGGSFWILPNWIQSVTGVPVPLRQVPVGNRLITGYDGYKPETPYLLKFDLQGGYRFGDGKNLVTAGFNLVRPVGGEARYQEVQLAGQHAAFGVEVAHETHLGGGGKYERRVSRNWWVGAGVDYFTVDLGFSARGYRTVELSSERMIVPYPMVKYQPGHWGAYFKVGPMLESSKVKPAAAGTRIDVNTLLLFNMGIVYAFY